MTIRNLEIFSEVCRCMNMSQAAQNLLISQSSVSQAVASLEREYQVTLFERLNHSLYLTDAGKDLLFLSHQVLKTIHQLNRRMNDSAYETRLRLGVSTTLGNCLIHPLLAAYRQNYREGRISVEMANTKSLEKKLLTAKMDIALIQQTAHSSHLEYIPLFEDEMIVICWKEHPLSGQTVSLEQLSLETMVTREKGSGTSLLTEQVFIQRGLTLRRGWVCSGVDAVKSAVLHQAGVAVISRFLVQRELNAGILGQIYLQDQPFFRRFDLAYHKDKVPDLYFRQFLDFCTQLGDAGMKKLIQDDILSFPA